MLSESVYASKNGTVSALPNVASRHKKCKLVSYADVKCAPHQKVGILLLFHV